MKAAILAVGLLAAASLGAAQAPPAANWRGWATCDLTITGPGYRDQQTQKWRTTGAAPTKRGAFDIYPGTWSVTGGGRLERTEGTQTLRAEWKRNVGAVPAPISVGVRASDGAILIGAGHAQLRAGNGVTGTQEVRVDGKVTSHTSIGLEAFEYAFPSSQAAAKSPHVSGDRSDAPVGSFGPMQPAGSKVEVRCLWDFQRGEAEPRGAALNPTATVSSATPKHCNRVSPATTDIEVEYAQRLQQNDTRRAQINGKLSALITTNMTAPKDTPQPQVSALQHQLQMLDTERTQLRDERNRKLAEAQRDADRAHAECERAP
ncbi:MAG TPA: hypothetical protein VE046_06575 [Steroidobacteraceae bacterium]|nr:hypothetical protein [Steroidobacteraceae bacterium]